MEERKSRYELFLEEETAKGQPKEKRCSKCEQYKVITEFYGAKRGKYGVTSVCKECLLIRPQDKDPVNKFWRLFRAKTMQDGECLVWMGSCSHGKPSCHWNGKRTTVRRVVYRLSLGDISDDMVVSASCDNPLCVRLSHFQVMTRAEFLMKLQNNAPFGTQAGGARLTEDVVREIRMLARQGMTQLDIAQRYRVSVGAVAAVIRGRSWTHVQ